MKILLSSTLIALAAALPATADVAAGSAAAIAHFNQDADSQDKRIELYSADLGGTVVSTRSGQTGEAYARFNAEKDSQDDIRGQQGATAYGFAPAHGADVFDVIDAE